MTSQNTTWWIVGVFLLTLFIFASALPPQSRSPWPHDECRTDDKIMDLCQQCAKHSRSTIVYPMCCQDSEDARSWCKKYITFGMHAT